MPLTSQQIQAIDNHFAKNLSRILSADEDIYQTFVDELVMFPLLKDISRIIIVKRCKELFSKLSFKMQECADSAKLEILESSITEKVSEKVSAANKRDLAVIAGPLYKLIMAKEQKDDLLKKAVEEDKEELKTIAGM